MTPSIALAADVLVAILLVATIATSVRLSGRVARLKADEADMRRTVGELLAASASAERAVAGLRAAIADGERDLSDALRAADASSRRLAEQVAAGEGVLNRVSRIAEASRRLGAAPDPAHGRGPEPAAAPADPGPSLRATVLVARDLAERAARRAEGRAA